MTKSATLRECTKCQRAYPATLAHFHKCAHGRGGLSASCKNCRNSAHSAYRVENRDEQNERARRRRAAAGVKRPARVEVVCGTCGASLALAPCKVKTRKGDAVFCSRECFNKSGTKRPSARKGRDVKCLICEKVFYVERGRADGRKYCGPACKGAAQASDPRRLEQLARARQNFRKGKPTSLEVAGYAMLDGLGLEYLPQHLINGKFCVDAFVPSLNLIIQFDGDYWHGNPEKFPTLNATQKRAVRYDKAHDSYTARCGYKVLRIWESELKARPEGVKARVLAAARDSAPAREPARPTLDGPRPGEPTSAARVRPPRAPSSVGC